MAEKGGVNTNSRAAALVDLRNFISAAAVSGAALTGVYAELLFNTDVINCFISTTTSLPRCGLLRKVQSGSRNETCRTRFLRSKVDDVLLISTSLHQRIAQFCTQLPRFAAPKLLSPHTFVLLTTCHYGYFRKYITLQT